MSEDVKILAFSGSTREGSWNRKLVAVAAQAAREAGAEVTLIDLRDYALPLYDGDLEAKEGLPDAAVALKTLFKDHQGLLIASPEYNSGFSGVLKNTIDWVSRQHGEESGLVPYRGKVAALLAASPGGLGGIRGLAMLRLILNGLQVMVIPQQHALSRAGQAFAEDGSLADEGQQKAVATVARRLVETVRAVSGR